MDGPSHFLKDSTTGEYVVNGPTQFKSRLLRALGWKVAHVTFLEWRERSESERWQLLVTKLQFI